MTKIQELLDKEAMLSNQGEGDGIERQSILTAIRLMRIQPAPVCFGDDDCSTSILVRCPWRIDCGE